MTIPSEQINRLSNLKSSFFKKNCPTVHGYPLVGVLPKLILNTLQFLEEVVKKYPNEIIALKIGWIKIYLATNPEHVKYVLSDNWKNFGRGKLKYKVVRQILGDSLLTSEGQSWLRNRRLMQPLFTTSQVNVLTELTIDIIANSIANLEKAGTKKTVDMGYEMSVMTQNVLLAAMFSSSIDTHQAEDVVKAMKTLTKEISHRIFLSFLPDWFPLTGEKALHNAIKTIDNIVLPIISQRRKSKENHKDLLESLLNAHDAETNTGMNNQQLRDECIGIYLAGFGGTSNTLLWVWYLLSEYPEVEFKVRQEIETVLGEDKPTALDVSKLQYTRKVIQEAMRLYPSSWFTARVLQNDDNINGYNFKAGDTIVLNSYLTHRLPQFWDQPEIFDPERFDKESSKEIHSYAYFPFGAGPHLCLGKHFALMEMQLIVAMIMQKFRVKRVLEHKVIPKPGITLHLRHGLTMSLEPNNINLENT